MDPRINSEDDIICIHVIPAQAGILLPNYYCPSLTLSAIFPAIMITVRFVLARTINGIAGASNDPLQTSRKRNRRPRRTAVS